jgi:FlaA1/EpsC-like NDP-sugar epimerase
MLAPPAIIAPTWLTVTLAVLALPIWIAIFTVYNLYERQHRSISLATFDEIGELFHALLAGSLLFLITSQVLRRVMGAEVYFPVEAAMFLATALPLVLLARGTVRSFVFPAVMNPRRTLIVGAGRGGRSLLRELRETPGELVVGFVDDDPRLMRRRLQGVPVLGGTREIERIIERARPDTVLVTIPDAPRERLGGVIDACARAEVPCRFVRRERDLDPRVILGAAAD